jgi:hypothetical protein
MKKSSYYFLYVIAVLLSATCYLLALYNMHSIYLVFSIPIIIGYALASQLSRFIFSRKAGWRVVGVYASVLSIVGLIIGAIYWMNMERCGFLTQFHTCDTKTVTTWFIAAGVLFLVFLLGDFIERRKRI